MKFQLAFSALVGFAMTAAAATVHEEVPYVISTRPLGDDGVLTLYGINSTSADTPTLKARQCGDPGVT